MKNHLKDEGACKGPPTIETISVHTIAGRVDQVPVIGWKELKPYWGELCRAFFDVLIENDFKPYTSTIKRPEGFVASSFYWGLSCRNPAKFPLSEARFFVSKLLEKPGFRNSIKEFNQSSQISWLEEKNIATLGGYVYSFYYTLRPVLKVVGKGERASVKPMLRAKISAN